MKTSKKKFWEVLATMRFVDWDHSGWIDWAGKTVSRVCPVCAVANKILGEPRFHCDQVYAARAIGLDVDFANKIANAADGMRCAKLRPKLLKVTGIKDYLKVGDKE